MTSAPNGVHKPGETAPLTGIYRVVHKTNHAGTFAFTVYAGKVFPPCEVCGDAIGYTLLRNAPAIETDEDFVP
jgi:hypothetical protein